MPCTCMRGWVGWSSQSSVEFSRVQSSSAMSSVYFILAKTNENLCNQGRIQPRAVTACLGQTRINQLNAACLHGLCKLQARSSNWFQRVVERRRPASATHTRVLLIVTKAQRHTAIQTAHEVTHSHPTAHSPHGHPAPPLIIAMACCPLTSVLTLVHRPPLPSNMQSRGTLNHAQDTCCNCHTPYPKPARHQVPCIAYRVVDGDAVVKPLCVYKHILQNVGGRHILPARTHTHTYTRARNQGDIVTQSRHGRHGE